MLLAGFLFGDELNRYKKVKRAFRRVNILEYIGAFGKIFGRGVSFLTLTQRGLKSSRELKRSRMRLMDYLKREYGLRYYITASEFQERGSIHYHIILFDVPYMDKEEIEKVWGEGWAWITRASSEIDAIRYLVKYVKKGLRLSWSYTFKEFVSFRNNFTSLVRYFNSNGVKGVGVRRFSSVEFALRYEDLRASIVKFYIGQMRLNKRRASTV